MAIACLAQPAAGRTLDPRRRMEVGSRSLLGAPRERLSLRATLATREEVTEADDAPPRAPSGALAKPDEDYEMPEIMTRAARPATQPAASATPDKEDPHEEDTLDDSVTAPSAPADGVILTKLPPVRKVRAERNATASAIPETTRSVVDRAAEAGEDAAETAATTNEKVAPAPASLSNATSTRTSERAPAPKNTVGTFTANETEAKKALAESLLTGEDAANGGDGDYDDAAPAPSEAPAESPAEAPAEAHAASNRTESKNATETDIVGVSEAPANATTRANANATATATTSTKSSDPAPDSDYAYFDPASGASAGPPPKMPSATEWDDVDEPDSNAVGAKSATRDDDRDAFGDDDSSDRADAVPEAERLADDEPAEKDAENADDARSPEIDADLATVDAATSTGMRASSSRSFEPRVSSPREDDFDARLGVVAEESSVDVAGAEARFGALAQAALGGAIFGLVGLVAYCRRGVSTAWTAPFTVTDATASKGGKGGSTASTGKGGDDWNDWSDDDGWGSDGGGAGLSRRPAASASEWAAEEPAWSDEEREGGGESEETYGWDGSDEDATATRVKERND